MQKILKSIISHLYTFLLHLNKKFYLYLILLMSSQTAFLTLKEPRLIDVTFPVLQMKKLRLREEVNGIAISQ